MKTTLLSIFGWLFLLSVMCLGQARPNIVFLLADDQRFDSLGAAGHPIIQTPNLDKLARDGVRFTNMTVAESMCHVSRVSMLSGLTARTSTNSGTLRKGYNAPEHVETLYTDLLREHGYRTAQFGKWHAWMPEGWTPEEHFDDFEHIFRDPYFKKQPDGSLRHETDLIVDRGIDFISRQSADKPFALNLWFNAAHAEDHDLRPGIGHYPWPRSVDGMYEEVVIPAPKLGAPEIYESQPEFLKRTINRERYFWRWDTPEKYQTNMRAYYRMISGIDHAVGRLLQALEEQGLADNTIVVYTADNGYYMGNRGFAGKWTHYDESLRVPLIVHDPRLRENRRGATSEALAVNLDLPSTFLDWAGVKVPEHYQGESLVGVIEGAVAGTLREETFHEHTSLRHMIAAWEGLRNKRYKYARYFDVDPAYEFLHDLENDPDELVNLAKDPAYADVLQEMRQRCAERVAEYGEAIPTLEE